MTTLTGSATGSNAEARVRRPGLVLAVVLVATFLINLDTTMVNVALPALGRELSTSTSDMQWVIDAYNLAFAGLILTGGTVGDRFGRRRTLALGLVGFGLSSGIAAAARCRRARTPRGLPGRGPARLRSRNVDATAPRTLRRQRHRAGRPAPRPERSLTLGISRRTHRDSIDRGR